MQPSSLEDVLLERKPKEKAGPTIGPSKSTPADFIYRMWNTVKEQPVLRMATGLQDLWSNLNDAAEDGILGNVERLQLRLQQKLHPEDFDRMMEEKLPLRKRDNNGFYADKKDR